MTEIERRHRIYVSETVRNRLLELGRMGDNYDDVLRRVLSLPPKARAGSRGRAAAVKEEVMK